MRYFDAWNLNYIWFGPLPFLNKIRLQKVRADNPQVKISLSIYKKLLTAREFESIDRFCTHNHIRIVMIEDLKKEVDKSGNETEKKLFDLIIQELENPNGNKAAASDILRAHTYFWLNEDSLSSGIYLDIDTQAFAPTLQWHTLEKSTSHPYLISCQQHINGRLIFANDVIILTTLEKKSNREEQKQFLRECLEPVQKSILTSYSDPILKIKNTKALPSILGSKNIFEIRAKISTLSFEDWVKITFEEYKKNYAPKEVPSIMSEAFLNTSFNPADPPDPIKLSENNDALRWLGKCYYQSFIPMFNQKLRDDYKEVTHYNLIRKQFSPNKNPHNLFGINILKAYHAMLLFEMYKLSVCEISGCYNFFNHIPRQNAALLSIQNHQLGMNYVGQLGPSNQFMTKSLCGDTDISWTEYGALHLIEKAKNAAIDVFKKHGLSASGLRTWLKNRKNAKIFKIKLWRPEHQHQSNTPPALRFLDKKRPIQSGDVVTIREECIPYYPPRKPVGIQFITRK